MVTKARKIASEYKHNLHLIMKDPDGHMCNSLRLVSNGSRLPQFQPRRIQKIAKLTASKPEPTKPDFDSVRS